MEQKKELQKEIELALEMTKREYFAAMAMNGLLATSKQQSAECGGCKKHCDKDDCNGFSWEYESELLIAEMSIGYADAILEQLAKD